MTTVDELAAEIRLVIGRVRSPSGLAELELPALDELAEGGRDGVPDLLASAIQRVSSEQYVLFLSLLLPFPFEPAAPWEQLGPNRRSDGRGERASRQAFGLSWDACNRAGQLLDGRSRRDWAERFLAEAVLVARESPAPVAAEPSEPPADHRAPDAGAEPAAAGSPGTAGRRRVLVVGAAALLLVVALVAAAMAARSSDEGADAEPEVADLSTVQDGALSCESIGSLDSTASLEPDAAGLTRRFVDLYATLDEVGCPIEPAFVWDELVVQELVDEAEPDLPGAMLLERASEVGTYLTPTAYAQYRRIGSGDGSYAQFIGGLPSPVQVMPDGHQEVVLSKGVVLVAETEGAPFFWLPADFVQLWRDSIDRLGLPTSNPMPQLEQDFQTGYAYLYQKASVPEIVELDDPGAGLPDLEELKGTAMRHRDGTVWWIGQDGKRYWVASGSVFNCLVPGGDSTLAAVRGYQIATLPYGGHAECPN